MSPTTAPEAYRSAVVAAEPTAPTWSFFSRLILLKTLNELNDHSHWRQRQKRAKLQKLVIKAELRSGLQKLRPTEVAAVTLARRAPSAGLDTDGLAASMKFVRDAIAELLGRDDSPASGIEWRYSQGRGEEYGVLVRVDVYAVTT